MAKELHDDLLDAALSYLSTNGNELVVCGTEPTTYTEAHTTYMLANTTLTGGSYTGPANGDASGRKITVNAQTSISPTSAGTGNWVCVTDTSNSKLLAKTSCPAKAFDTGDTLDIAAFDIEIQDPT